MVKLSFANEIYYQIMYRRFENIHCLSIDGAVKLVSKVAIPANPNSGTKSQLTSLLTTPTQNKTLIGTRRIYMTKCKYHVNIK